MDKTLLLSKDKMYISLSQFDNQNSVTFYIRPR